MAFIFKVEKKKHLLEPEDEGSRILQNFVTLYQSTRSNFSEELNLQNPVRSYITRSHNCTYLPNPYSTVLLEKLTGSQLVKKFPALYGNQRSLPQ